MIPHCSAGPTSSSPRPSIGGWSTVGELAQSQNHPWPEAADRRDRVATHIHHPTDSTLLYDGVRVLGGRWPERVRSSSRPLE